MMNANLQLDLKYTLYAGNRRRPPRGPAYRLWPPARLVRGRPCPALLPRRRSREHRPLPPPVQQAVTVLTVCCSDGAAAVERKAVQNRAGASLGKVMKA